MDFGTETARRVFNWDRHDARELAEHLRALDHLGLDVGALVDLAALRSVAFPSDVDTAWPVWAMDERGYCVTGKGFDVEHVDQVRAAQREARRIQG